jgi:hypothetical protein
MGTQGLGTSAPIARWAAGKSRRLRLTAVISSLMVPALAGCSSNFSWPIWSSNPPPSQAAVVGPPPGSMAPAAQSANAAPPPAATAAAPPPQQGGNVGSLTDSYVSFLEMFRDHPQPSPAPAPPQYAAAPPPQYSAAPQPQSSASTAPGQIAAPKSAGYASNSPAPQPAQPRTAPPASSAQNPPVAPPSSYAPKPAATPTTSTDDPRNKVYPTVSILDLFKDGTPGSTSAPNVPHPPSTYTPSGQPYSPPAGQAAATTAAPAAEPADANPAASAYPKESLVDFFKRQAQESQ